MSYNASGNPNCLFRPACSSWIDESVFPPQTKFYPVQGKLPSILIQLSPDPDDVLYVERISNGLFQFDSLECSIEFIVRKTKADRITGV